jgi:hypothetical protein
MHRRWNPTEVEHKIRMYNLTDRLTCIYLAIERRTQTQKRIFFSCENAVFLFEMRDRKVGGWSRLQRESISKCGAG